MPFFGPKNWNKLSFINIKKAVTTAYFRHGMK